MSLPNRKHIRLKEYDYGQPGAYFITVCTRDKECTLGRICVGPDALIGPYAWNDCAWRQNEGNTLGGFSCLAG